MPSSPPLSPLYLAPVPYPSRPKLTRPSSVISTTSLRSSRSEQPPSSYGRRSRSLQLLEGIRVLAPARENEDEQEQIAESRRSLGFGRLESLRRGKSKSTSGSTPLKADWEIVEVDLSAQTEDRLVVFNEPTPHKVEISSNNPSPPLKMAQEPSPKKKGFFRRLSLSASTHKAQVSPSSNGSAHLSKPAGRSVSGGGPLNSRKDPSGMAGPAYDSLPPGAAPSAYRSVRQDGSRDPRKADTPPTHHNFPDHNPQYPNGSASRSSRPAQPAPPPMYHHSSASTSSQSYRSAQSGAQTPPANNRYTSASPPSQQPPSPSTPKRNTARNPIHAALASPPSASSGGSSGTHPYDVRTAGSNWKQSYSIPSGLNAEGQSSDRGGRSASATHASPPPPAQAGPSISGLANALPPLPKSISSASRFADADPAQSSPSRSPSAGPRRSTAKTPPISSRTPRQSDVSVPSSSPATTTRTKPTPSPLNSSATSTTTATAPPLPHTRTSYFPKTSQNDAPVSAPASPPNGRTPYETPGAMSEASAYAKSISSQLQGPKGTPERENTSSAPPVAERQRKSSRPLPQPPNPNPIPARTTAPGPPAPAPAPVDGRQRIVSPTPQKARPRENLVSPNGNGHADPSPSTERKSLEKTRPTVIIPDTGADRGISTQPYPIDFSHSPTLPPLRDPRENDRRGQAPPIAPPAKATSAGPPAIAPPVKQIVPNGAAPLESNQLPARRTSVLPQLGRGPLASSPISSSRPDQSRTRKVSGHSARTQPSTRLKKNGRPTLAYLLAHSDIQSALLPWLTINSFLSLTGCSDAIRKQLSGELVGRWILKEWGLQVDREKGRSWPNLTVWEGFLESLLHDPATYSTYPPQWHSLLQHLSLSHTLIVLHLRNLPATAFPNSSLLPFEDESSAMMTQLPFSQSTGSLASMNLPLPRSRVPSNAGSDGGSITPSTRTLHGPPPKSQERLVEIVMPEPLAAKPKEEMKEFELPEPTKGGKLNRRGSRTSIISTASLGLGRRRANSTAKEGQTSPSSASIAAPNPGKNTLPPVSFPTAKRYTFTRHGDQSVPRSRTMSGSASSRPGSVFSVASSPAQSIQPRMSIGPVPAGRASFAVDRNAPPVPVHPHRSPGGLTAPSFSGLNSHRSSFASSDGRSNRVSEFGNYSPINPRFGSPFPMRNDWTPPPRIEQAFERPPPYTVGRAPILRVFVPLSERVRRWPSAEGAAASIKELDKCGATRRLKLGDLVVNTAIKQPKHTEHVLLFVPYIKHLLVPLEYRYNEMGHLPSYLDAFTIPPSYYYPFLPAPQIVFLNLAPYCIMAMGAIRLAFDRRDVTTASGARISAKRYLHVTGFEVRQGDNAAPEWQGMVSLESEGTAEGKMELERRLGGGDPNKAGLGPWEVIREKSMMGTIWLRLVKEESVGMSPHSPQSPH